MPHHERLVTAAHRVARGAACLTAIAGFVVVLGWVLDVDALKGIVPGVEPVKFNAAIGFILAGTSLWLLRAEDAPRRRRRAGGALGCAVAVLAALTLAEWIFGVSLGIDSLYYSGDNPRWGRPPPHSAAAFLAVGVWLWLLAVRRPWANRARAYLSVLACLLVLQALIGYLYGVRYLYGSGEVNRMSPQAITILGVMCVGMLAARPEHAFVALLTSNGPGGVVARRLTPAVLLAPIGLGALRLAAQEHGLIDLREGLAIMAGSALAGLGAIVVYTGFSLNRSDAERRALAVQAEEANRAKSEFLSRMSHELRTPLHAILGFGGLLERGELQAAQRDQVAQITRAGRHLLELINEVLDITRIERHALRLSVEPIGVRAVVCESLDMIAPLAESHSVKIAPPAFDDPAVHVVADRQRLKQVLLNLLSNAVKYNRAGGEVRVGVTCLGASTVRIAVTDTGAGIAQADLARAFAAFERLGAETSEIEGTGLGLALTKLLVATMGGEIGVDSEVGRGTTFWVELPATAAPEVPEAPIADAPAPAEPGQGGTRTILCVEDNPSNVELVKAILTARPEVGLLVARDGNGGLQLAREHRPAMVLLDLHLPDISGEEVLRRLRGDARTADLSIVMLSADASPGQSERLRDAGADDFLTKPFDIERFLAVIDSTAGGERGAGTPQAAAPATGRRRR